MAVTAAEASIAPPPPAPAAEVEEGGTTAEASASRVALETSAMAGPSGEDAMVALNQDSAAPSSSENHDVVIPPALGPTQEVMTASCLPAVEVSGPSPTAEASGPPPTAEVAKTSSAWVALTAKEVMELVTCRYINFPGIGVINLEAPQFPEKAYEVVSERMSNELTIMETTASVSKAQQEYKRAGGFALAAGAEVADAALVAPVDHVEPTADVSAPSSVDEGQEAPPLQSAEAANAPAFVAEAGVSEAIVGEEASSSPRPVAANIEGVETRVPDESAAIVQGPIAP
jgi:hypothetical protein